MRVVLAEYKEVMRQGARATKERDDASKRLASLQAEQEALKAKIIAAGLWCAACERPLDDVKGGHAHGG
jgi:hypothetical protein